MFVAGSGYLVNIANLPARMHQYSIGWWERRLKIRPVWLDVVPFWVWRLTIGVWFCGWSIVLAVTAERSL